MPGAEKGIKYTENKGTRDYSLLRLCHIMQGNSAECGEMPDQVSKSHGTKCVTGSMEPVTNT